MTRYIAVYLDTAQVQALRDDAQETVLAADEDLEITKQLNDLTARRPAGSLVKRSTRSATCTSRSSTSYRKQLSASTSVRATTSTSKTHSPMSATIEEATRHQEKQGGTG